MMILVICHLLFNLGGNIYAIQDMDNGGGQYNSRTLSNHGNRLLEID